MFCTKFHDLVDNCRMLFNSRPVADSFSRKKINFLSANNVINVNLFADCLSTRLLMSVISGCSNDFMYAYIN